MYKAQDLKNKKISVIGAARSGISVAKLLQKFNAEIFISDKGDRIKLSKSINEFEAEGIQYEVGGHSDKALDCEFAVISPGVPSNSEIIQKLTAKGKKIYSEVEVASWFCKGKIIAVTGSNGKTTTTSLIYDIIKRSGKPVFVAGNIGYPFSDFVYHSKEDEIAVLEISSFQLDHCETFQPKVSVITNITPDHIDRYGTFDNYIKSKGRVFMNQDKNDFLVYNYDDIITSDLVQKAKANLLPFSIKEKPERGGYIENSKIMVNLEGVSNEVIENKKINIKGKHNLYNSLASVLSSLVVDVKMETIRESLQKFEGVEHRLEFVRELKGVRFYNDSKATNVDSVWYALESFNEPVILIAGGRDKGNDYTSILPLIEKKVKAAVLIGEAAEKMEREFGRITELFRAYTMEEAVRIAFVNAKPGDVVVLSPACASFDMFDNYEHRGKVFKQSVLNL